MKKLVLKTILAVLGFLAFWLLLKHVIFVEPEQVNRQGVKVYVTDPSGVAWDVSQAEVSGLSPRHFRFVGLSNMPATSHGLVPAGRGLPGDTMVLGISAGEHSLAIATGTIRKDIVINNALGDKSIVALYNPVSDSYHAYESRIKEDTFTIRLTGWVYKDVPVLTDEEEGALWHPGRGGLVVVQGENLGNRLYEIDSELTDLGSWLKKYPSSLVLK